MRTEVRSEVEPTKVNPAHVGDPLHVCFCNQRVKSSFNIKKLQSVWHKSDISVFMSICLCNSNPPHAPVRTTLLRASPNFELYIDSNGFLFSTHDNNLSFIYCECNIFTSAFVLSWYLRKVQSKKICRIRLTMIRVQFIIKVKHEE